MAAARGVSEKSRSEKLIPFVRDLLKGFHIEHEQKQGKRGVLVCHLVTGNVSRLGNGPTQHVPVKKCTQFNVLFFFFFFSLQQLYREDRTQKQTQTITRGKNTMQKAKESMTKQPEKR